MRAFHFLAPLILSTVSISTSLDSLTDGERFTMYSLPYKPDSSPSGPKYNHRPCDADTGPDQQTLWYFDATHLKVGVFNVSSGSAVEYALPEKRKARKSNSLPGETCVVRTGADGMIYMGVGSLRGLYQIDPSSTPPKIVRFGTVSPNNGWAGETGIWLSETDANLVWLFRYDTHALESFPVQAPAGMRTDDNGNLWVASFYGSINEIDNITGVVTEYQSCCPLPDASFLEALRASTNDGKYLWIGVYGSRNFVRIDTVRKSFQVIPGDEGAGWQDASDACGRIWTPGIYNQSVSYFNPKTGYTQNVYFPINLPANDGGSTASVVHQGPGNYMWFFQTGSVWRYNLERC